MRDGIHFILLLVLLWTLVTAKRNLVELVETKSKGLESEIKTLEEDLGRKIDETSESLLHGITETRSDVARLNTVYGGLLAAQKRRTLDSLYGEDFVPLKMREAYSAFRAGRYLEASALYAEVSEAQRDNREARFYQYYAIFLANKGDRNNYRAVAEAFTALEHSGYSRKEISETLSFINKELSSDPGQFAEGGAL
ncbi:MAG: hypothetical protein LBB82_03795 [Treponema sp.]|jgi:hypothetical protein|nr:hypothetical protein [Treponema sp.]